MEPLSNLPNTSKLINSASDIKYKTFVIVSDNARYVITLINYTFLCEFISLFGCVTNVINLIVFYRQGLNTTINISFFSLAISDFCSLIMQQVSNIFVNPLIVALNLPLVYGEVQWAATRLIRATFTRITFFVTVYITAERCLCIAFPLHIKQLITPSRSVVILVFIYIFTLGTFLPVFASVYIDWKFHPGRNMTLLRVVYRTFSSVYIPASYCIVAMSGIIAFVIVVVLTLILILKLREKSDWRKMANVQQEKSQTMSQRDMATVKMVVIITGILIVCFIPSVFICFIAFLEPEFREDGEYHNLYSSLWSIGMVMENINSSVNIYFYFQMSSRYREAFRELFSACSYNKTAQCQMKGKQQVKSI